MEIGFAINVRNKNGPDPIFWRSGLSNRSKPKCRMRTNVLSYLYGIILIALFMLNRHIISYIEDIQSEEVNHRQEQQGSLKDNGKSSLSSTKTSSATSENRDHLLHANDNFSKTKVKIIRKWGCGRTETPLIFVHIGKSGGGSVRARIAASAVGYDRGEDWNKVHDDAHFYPIQNNWNGMENLTFRGGQGTHDTSIRKGSFCNSYYPQYVDIPNIRYPLTSGNYEKSQVCNATTPFGIAIACHHPYKKGRGRGQPKNKVPTSPNHFDHYTSLDCHRCDDDFYLDADYYFDSKQRKDKNSKILVAPPYGRDILDPSTDPSAGQTCDIVYAGHNDLGSELNWLPPRYLKEHWWDKIVKERRDLGNEENTQGSDIHQLDEYWKTLLNDRSHRRAQLRTRIAELDDPVASGWNVEHWNSEQSNDATNTETPYWCSKGYIPVYKLDATRRAKQGKDYVERERKYELPSTHEDYIGAYEECGKPLAEAADQAFLKYFASKNFSPIYASMPLHRITMLRDPWTWIVSKFFWHNIHMMMPWHGDILPCSNVNYTTDKMANRGTQLNESVSKYKSARDPLTGRTLGWVEHFSIVHLIKLCGNDCRIRYENGMMTLADMESQAESNLRYAFSVVGLLNETDSFYDMITDRIDYVNMTYNAEVSGDRHKTTPTQMNFECKELFQKNTTFREMVRKDVPAFAALERVFEVGVAVNRFQKEELRECRLSKGKEPTKGSYGSLID